MKRKFTHIRSHCFQGRRYRILWRRPDAASDGLCDNPKTTGKVIQIGAQLGEFDLLETAIHESGHACFFNMDEPHMAQGAHDIAKFLWRMGWRLPL